jgi:hypothetical protein
MSWKETDTPFKLFLAFYTKIGICKVCPLRAFTRVFFFLLSQTGFVWLPCVCVILFFQSGIAVIVWDFPEWRRLCFTEISTFLLFNFLLTASAHLLLGVTSNSLNFKFYISICVSILTCCEYLIFSDLFNRNIWITEHQPELQQHPEWITVLTLFYHTIRWGWPPCWG